MTSNDLSFINWLAPLGCYYENLRDHGYDDMLTLEALTEEELRLMLETCGVHKEGHRVLFRRKINTLRSGALPPPPAAPAAAMPLHHTPLQTLPTPITQANLPLQVPQTLPSLAAVGAAEPQEELLPLPRPVPVNAEDFRMLGARSKQIADTCAMQLSRASQLSIEQQQLGLRLQQLGGEYAIHHVPEALPLPTVTPVRLPAPPPQMTEVEQMQVDAGLPPATIDSLRVKRDTVSKYLQTLDEKLASYDHNDFPRGGAGERGGAGAGGGGAGSSGAREIGTALSPGFPLRSQGSAVGKRPAVVLPQAAVPETDQPHTNMQEKGQEDRD